MSLHVDFTDDPARALSEARPLLAAEPVFNNVILTLLRDRTADPIPGRYWLARDGDGVAGFVFQSPVTFPAIMTPMAPDVIEALVDAIARDGVALPGINAEAATAARFAGQWTERHKSAAVPIQGQRLYEVVDVVEGAAVSGHLRPIEPSDRELAVAWSRAFRVDVGEEPRDPPPNGEEPRNPPPGLGGWTVCFWDDGGPASMAAASPPVEGVVRIGHVYTPPERRRRGYAGACVRDLSRRARDAGHRCILYTDLGNPTSNSVYRRIGYRAVAEFIRYRFA